MKVESAKKCSKRVGKDHTCRLEVSILSVGGKEEANKEKQVHNA
jgi:hypothetical protein